MRLCCYYWNDITAMASLVNLFSVSLFKSQSILEMSFPSPSPLFIQTPLHPKAPLSLWPPLWGFLTPLARNNYILVCIPMLTTLPTWHFSPWACYARSDLSPGPCASWREGPVLIICALPLAQCPRDTRDGIEHCNLFPFVSKHIYF